MITLRRWARHAGLDLAWLVAVPEARHRTLLQSYQLNLHRGRAAVRRMIIGDLLGCIDNGAQSCAADLLIVLRLFLSEQGNIRRPRADRRPVRQALGLSKPLHANAA